MSWQVLIFISMVTYSFSVLLQRILLKEETNSPIAFAVLFSLLGGIMIGAFGFATADMRLPSMDRLLPVLPNFILMVIVYAIGSILLYTALKHLEASLYTIVFSSRVLFTIVASTFFLHEGLRGTQFVGVVLILLGIVLVHVRRNMKSSNVFFNRYVWMIVLAAVLFGVEITNDRYLLNTFSLYPFISLAFILPGILLALFDWNIVKKLRVFMKKGAVNIVLLSALYAVSAVTFYAAMQTAPNLSQVASVNMLSVVLTVFLAIILLKEREHVWQKLAGAVVSTVGLFLVA